MNTFERKNLIFRLITALILLGSLSVSVLFLLFLVNNKVEETGLLIAAIVVEMILVLIESIILIKNTKKDLIINGLVFNENKKINYPMFVIVIIGLVLGLFLLIAAIVVFNTNSDLSFKTTAAVTIPIASYLLINCFDYLVYLILYKERPLKLEDLLK